VSSSPNVNSAALPSVTNNGGDRTGVLVHTAELGIKYRAAATFPSRAVQATVVRQDSRRLFDTIDTAWHAWRRYGRPERTRIGITARTNGTQRVWLDTPDSEINWPLPV
jgi:hypothetical protein